jgi:hypothetical protein
MQSCMRRSTRSTNQIGALIAHMLVATLVDAQHTHSLIFIAVGIAALVVIFT